MSQLSYLKVFWGYALTPPQLPSHSTHYKSIEGCVLVGELYGERGLVSVRPQNILRSLSRHLEVGR